MWEAISNIFTSANASIVMAFLLIILIIVSLLSRRGILSINTKGLTLGADIQERDIIRQQCEWAHNYIKSLYSYVQPLSNQENNGYMTKYILEVAYSEVVKWITFNHIKLNSEYVHVKQLTMRSLIYSFDIESVYRTPEFEEQINSWVEEIIKKLQEIRTAYNR